MTSGPTTRIARFASELDLADVPAEVVAHAKTVVLDALGCALHGSTLPWSRIMQQVAADEGGNGQAAVWGTAQRATRSQSAWLNSAAVHGFEFDDVHMAGMIHLGALTLPPAAAMAQGSGLSGRDLLAAIIAGCEVGVRVGQAVSTAHFRAGYHPQGTVGVFAAAAAAGRAAGLSPDRMAHAIGVAGSHAAGLMGAQRGAMTKRLHSGHAAQSGTIAALLAARGFTGATDVLEAEFGGFGSTMGGGAVDYARLETGLGSLWETARIGFKPFASCAAAQSSIEAVRRLRERSGLHADDVVEVVLYTTEHARVHSGWSYEPSGVTAAQMSIGYGVSRILLDGVLSASHFDEARIGEPAVLRMAARVRVEADPEFDARGADRRYAVRAVVRTTDGRVLTESLDDRPGNDTMPLDPAVITAKYTDLAAGVIGADAAAALRAAVARLEELDETDTLIALTGRRP